MYITGTVRLSSTGTVSVTLGFKPTWVRLTVGSKAAGSSENYMHQSVGAADGVAQTCISTFYDASGGKTLTAIDAIIDHYERINGIQSVLKASFAGFTATGVKFNVAIPNSNYPIMLEAGN